MSAPTCQDYAAVFLSHTPMIDVRAPIEFDKGAFPGASNLPLLSDDEREKIGICYKQSGHHAAVALGEQLVSGRTRAARIQAWSDYLDTHPEAFLYCFRGGMRSRVSQQWIAEETGHRVVRIAGGYKAMRRYLIDFTEARAAEAREDTGSGNPFIRLGGRTGAGKTRVLHGLPNAIDLEGLAKHKGSAFGAELSPQPPQIQFENELAIQLLHQHHTKQKTLVFEDEGRHIGSLHTPTPLYTALAQSPLVVLERPLEERIQVSLEAYVIETLARLRQSNDEPTAVDTLNRRIEENLNKIQRRLGAERHAKARALLAQAVVGLKKTGSLQGFESLIALLLTNYYDPMYDYQIDKKRPFIVFSGKEEAVASFLLEQQSSR